MKKSFKLLMIITLFAAAFTACKEVPTSGFSYQPFDVTQYEEVSFTSTATGATSYAWDFGDGSTSTEMNPIHIFTTSGSFTVSLVATNEDGDDESSKFIDVTAPVNAYTFGDTSYTIDAEMFWHQSSAMGGGPAPDPYIRLLTSVEGQENPDLLKLYPNLGLGDLPGTYPWSLKTFMVSPPEGSYGVGYDANYSGMDADWRAIGKEGSGDLVITELVEGIYKIEGTMNMSLGNYDFSDGSFVETDSAFLILNYTGGVTPLTK